MVDFKKVLEAAKTSIVAAVVWGIFSELFHSYLVGLPVYIFYLPYLLIFGYAGYKSTKEMKLDLLSAGVAGSLAAILSMFIFWVPFFVYSYVFPTPSLLEQFNELSSYVGSGGGIVMSVVVSVLLAVLFAGPLATITGVINFIVGLAGGLLGQKLK